MLAQKYVNRWLFFIKILITIFLTILNILVFTTRHWLKISTVIKPNIC